MTFVIKSTIININKNASKPDNLICIHHVKMDLYSIIIFWYKYGLSIVRSTWTMNISIEPGPSASNYKHSWLFITADFLHRLARVSPPPHVSVTACPALSDQARMAPVWGRGRSRSQAGAGVSGVRSYQWEQQLMVVISQHRHRSFHINICNFLQQSHS